MKHVGVFGFILSAVLVGGSAILSRPGSGPAAEDEVGRLVSAPPVEPGVGDMLHEIVTIHERLDGKKVFNYGAGFVVGRRLYTVNHNVDVDPGHAGRTTISVEGTQLIPVVTSQEQDLAIFDVPDALCETVCNDLSVPSLPHYERGREVMWVRQPAKQGKLVFGRIRDFAMLGEPALNQADWACDGNLVVEIDQPFLQGSSGGPVIDAQTFEVIGIIQGSFEGKSGKSGFFKPIECAQDLISRKQ